MCILCLLTVVYSLVFAGGGQQGSTGTAGGNKDNAIFWAFGGDSDTPVDVTNRDWNPKHPEYQVTAIKQSSGAGTTYFEKVAAAFAAGSGPDIFMMSAGDIMKYIDSGIAYPLDKWIRPNINDYVPASIEAVTFNGKIYAMPNYMDLLALFYDKDLFTSLNLQPPETWEEFIDTAKKLATPDRYGAMIFTTPGAGTNFFFHPFVWMSGGDVLSKDRKTVVINSDITINALQFYRDVINSGAVNKSDPADSGDLSWLATGRAAMMFAGSWAVPGLKKNYPNFNLGVIPYPVPKKGMKSSTNAGGWKLLVSSRGKNPDKAGEFANWLYNDDPAYAAEMCKNSAAYPARHTVAEYMGSYFKEYPYDYFLNELLPLASMELSLPSEITQAYSDAIQEALYTTRPIKDVVAEAAKKSEEAIK
jgi:multiple sugar transport system substrate-binding protein